MRDVAGPVRGGVTARKLTGVLRVLLRLPIWPYRANLGCLFGHRLVPADVDDPTWPEVAARAHAVAFRPRCLGRNG